MLPPNLISALQVLSRAGKPLVTATPDTPPPAAVAKMEPGQKFQGTVQAEISQGLFKVQVAGQAIQMRLPSQIKSGDVLELEVISTQPRLTFQMAASTNPLSTPEQIGGMARLLSNLTEQPLEKPIVQQLGSKAVWPSSEQAPDSKQLAGALREALANSGLFYESHQAQWVRGERSTAQLLVEPQNQLTGKTVLPGADGNSQQPTGQQLAARPLLLQQNDDLYSSPSTSSPQSPKPAGDPAQPIARELVPLVQQQLHTLETHQLTWVGQVWPGQDMQWEIQGQPEHQAPRQQAEREWSTEMELALPKLGDVHARLTFAGSGLRMTLHAADSSTVELFNRSLPQLRNRLADAGITLASAMVEKS